MLSLLLLLSVIVLVHKPQNITRPAQIPKITTIRWISNIQTRMLIVVHRGSSWINYGRSLFFWVEAYWLSSRYWMTVQNHCLFSSFPKKSFLVVSIFCRKKNVFENSNDLFYFPLLHYENEICQLQSGHSSQNRKKNGKDFISFPLSFSLNGRPNFYLNCLTIFNLYMTTAILVYSRF